MRIIRTFLAVVLPLTLSVAGPAAAQVPQITAKPELEQLLTALAQAPSPEIAARMEARIAQLWLQQGGPTVSLLMSRGTRNLQAGDAAEALEDFNAALALEPKLPETFGHRALARFHAGDVSGAFRDLEQAVTLEPRDFVAWRSLSAMAEAQGNNAGALAAWKKLLEIDPKTAGADIRLKDLTTKVEGEAL